MNKLTRIGTVVGGAGLLLLSVASNVYAQETPTVPAFFCPSTTEGAPTGTAGVCTLDLSVALPNAINIFLFVAFAAALVFLIYGGVRWVLSGGDKEGTAKAKGTVTAALIGLAIVLASWLLVNIVLYFFGIGNFSTIPNIFGSGGDV